MGLDTVIVCGMDGIYRVHCEYILNAYYRGIPASYFAAYTAESLLFYCAY